MMPFVFSSRWWLPMKAKISFKSLPNFEATEKLHLEPLSLQFSLAKKLTAFSAQKDPAYLWACWRSSFFCSLGSCRFATSTPPLSVQCFAPLISPLSLHTVLCSLEMVSQELPVCLYMPCSKPGNHSWRSGRGHRAVWRACHSAGERRTLHYFVSFSVWPSFLFLPASSESQMPSCFLALHSVVGGCTCCCFGAGYAFLSQCL